MKQILLNLKSNLDYRIRVLLIPVLLLTFTNFATAQTLITDANFEQALIDLNIDRAIDGDGIVNGQVSTAAVEVVTSLDISSRGISNLTGIQDFAALETFVCRINSVTGSLDLSMLTNLTSIELYNNQITAINVTGLTNLTYLELWINQLTSLDVSSNTNLTYLDCDDNQFSSLNVSALTSLEEFYCNENLLTSIDLRGLSSLTTFQSTSNPRLSCILIDTVPPASGWLKDVLTTYCTLTTYSGGSWSPAAPTATNSAVIEGDYSAAANITACSLMVKNNATVTIPSTFNVNLAGALTVEAGSSFTLSNNSNLLQTNRNSINSGAIAVKRNSNALLRSDYTLWSSPVASQNLLAFSPATTATRFYSYNPGTSQYNAIAIPSTTPFTVGRGYLIRMPNDADAVTPTPYVGSFTGVPNNGNVTVPLTIGFNLVGNPYPSNISFTTLRAANSGLIGTTAYFWRKTNGAPGTAYCTYNTAGSTYVSNNAPGAATTFDGTIQSGQGFFVNATAAGNLNFTNLQRTGTTANQAFFKTKRITTADKIWLNATTVAGDFSQMAVTYSDGATPGVDDYDSKYINDNGYALTSIIEGGEYTIQGRPAFDTADTVALNFKTTATGNFTIALARTEGVFEYGQEVYLVDNTTGVETNLKAGAYNFTANAGVDNSRFTLKYQKTLKVDALALNEDSLTVYSNDGTLYINSGFTAIQNIKVFDIQGRLVGEQKNVKANTASISNLKANQALIVQITSEDNIVVNKKVVN